MDCCLSFLVRQPKDTKDGDAGRYYPLGDGFSTFDLFKVKDTPQTTDENLHLTQTETNGLTKVGNREDTTKIGCTVKCASQETWCPQLFKMKVRKRIDCFLKVVPPLMQAVEKVDDPNACIHNHGPASVRDHVCRTSKSFSLSKVKGYQIQATPQAIEHCTHDA